MNIKLSSLFFYPSFLAIVLILTHAAHAQEDIEPGALGFELAPEHPSVLDFELEELEAQLCGSDPTAVSSKREIEPPPPVYVGMELRPMLLCTEVTEPDQVVPVKEGQDVLITVGDPARFAPNGTASVDLSLDILRFASAAPVELSCGTWSLEAGLAKAAGSAGTGSAWVLRQADEAGGLLEMDLTVDLELRFTEDAGGVTTALWRRQTFSGAASWSSKAVSLGRAPGEYFVIRRDEVGICFAEHTIASTDFSPGWSASKDPQVESFCLVDHERGGQLCLRPVVK